MKKLILILLLLCFVFSISFAKEYEYDLPGRLAPVTLIFSETAHLGSVFLTEKSAGYFTQIIFSGIDSNNNIHFLKMQARYGKFSETFVVSQEIILVTKHEPQKHIFLDLLLTTVEINISPVNNSYIKIRLFPNEYIKEP